MSPADAVAAMHLRVPARGNRKLRRLLENVDADPQIKAWWHVANVNAVLRLAINDHSWVHIQIITNIALKLCRLLVKHGVQPSIVRDYGMQPDDSEVVVVLPRFSTTSACRSTGAITRTGACSWPSPRCGSCSPDVYDEPERTVVVSEALQAITSHRADGEPLSLEAGMLRVADALDMAKGRSRIPFERGSVSIHSLSAAAIDEVRITDGQSRPVMVEIVMNNSSGIYQVDGLLKAKLTGSGLEPYVEVDRSHRYRGRETTRACLPARDRRTGWIEGLTARIGAPLRGRLTAGRLALDQEVGVRIPAPQPRGAPSVAPAS